MSEQLTVEVDGRPVCVRRWLGSLPAVVMVHGAGGNHDTLRRLGDGLAGHGVQVLAPSLPGRCGSEGPPLASVPQAADWMAELLEALALDDPLVLGHSFGGAVALELALRHPERVRGLVLVATGARLRVHPTILELMEQAAASGTPADMGRMAWRPDTDPAVVEEALAIAGRTPPETALTDWRAANAFDRMGQLQTMDRPVLAVGGEQDALTPPKYIRYLADHLLRGRLILLPDAGHMLPMERPGDLAGLVLDLRSGLPRI